MLLILVALFGLSLGGCKKEQPAAPAETTAQEMVEDAEDAAEEMADEAEEMADEAEAAVDEATKE
jgi:hypothetical protein